MAGDGAGGAGGLRGAVWPLVIIGSGPAGYTAAIYAARAGLRPLLFAGQEWGGQLMTTTAVENYPGFPDGIEGPDLMDAMRAQARRVGAAVRDRDVTAVDLGQRPFRATTHDDPFSAGDDQAEMAAAVIVATGASARWLGVPGEDTYRGQGVSSCATCDGPFFRGRRVAVVGGGDVAMEEALFLAHLASEVVVIHRRDTLRASRVLADRARANERISFLWDATVDDVLGNGEAATGTARVTGLRTRDVRTGDRRTLAIDALFVAIGHRPNTDIFRGHLPLDRHGYALAVDAGGTATAVPGVFVAGDVRDHRYRQAVTAAGDGCKAAIDAERWLDAQGVPARRARAVADRGL